MTALITFKAQVSPVHAPGSAANWSVFWVASIAVFLVSINGTVLFAAFGALRNGFPQSTAVDMSWVLNAYTVVYAALLVPAGRLSDALGRKRVFQLGAWAAEGIARIEGMRMLRFNTSHECKLHPLLPATAATIAQRTTRLAA